MLDIFEYKQITGEVEVKFGRVHSGHGFEMKHLFLRPQQMKHIAAMMRQGSIYFNILLHDITFEYILKTFYF